MAELQCLEKELKVQESLINEMQRIAVNLDEEFKNMDVSKTNLHNKKEPLLGLISPLDLCHRQGGAVTNEMNLSQDCFIISQNKIFVSNKSSIFLSTDLVQDLEKNSIKRVVREKLSLTIADTATEE
ncbi:hypothetical protein AVEN_203843-1 [Araneus ventricosus]|uniref:Uncharacterized protein n=1 Tax=Araneus ventricosus TaxID=182803 RepID=A0A4Y2X333_ARAVE|nr:hypothetical protein AVEN_203843-1 [Araneus ventricosus]